MLYVVLFKFFFIGESENFDKEIKTSIIESFKQTDNDFLKIASNKYVYCKL